MYNTEILNSMKPQISASYRLQPGMLIGGTLDDVPKEAFGAQIYQCSYIVEADGEFRINGVTYDIFVGQLLDIEETLKIVVNEVAKAKLTELKAKGYKKAVIPKFPQDNHKQKEIWPLGWRDRVVSSNQELAVVISKINQTYNSIDFEIRNSAQEIDRVNEMGL
jgi:hypothetical protein